MSATIESVLADAAAAREKAEKRARQTYREIITGRADASRLPDVQRVLGLTDDAVRADVAMFEQVQELKARLPGALKRADEAPTIAQLIEAIDRDCREKMCIAVRECDFLKLDLLNINLKLITDSAQSHRLAAYRDGNAARQHLNQLRGEIETLQRNNPHIFQNGDSNE